VDVVVIVNQAFKPNSALTEPFLFSGRVAEIERVTEALREAESVVALLGPRGFGKTSLALQMLKIAEGA
jgi:predicted AAA+ superfamily ATPase